MVAAETLDFLEDLAARGLSSPGATGLESGALLPAGCFLARGLAGVLRGFFSAEAPGSSLSAPRFPGRTRAAIGVAVWKPSFFLICPNRTWVGKVSQRLLWSDDQVKCE